MVTSDVEAGHGAFVMVHANTLFPKPNPVIAVVGDTELETTPDPEIKLQVPVPASATLAFIVVVGEEAHRV